MTDSDQTGPGADRRKHPRIAPTEPVRISLEGPSGRVAKGLALNVSEGGACVTTDGEPLIDDTEVIARISFAAHPPVVLAAARVAWAQLAPERGHGRYGLQWAGEGFQRERLGALIRSVLPAG